MIHEKMKSESTNGSLEKFGFSLERGSAHMARTMMLLELRLLLDSVPASSSSSTAYIQAIEEDNCLEKRSRQTRTLTRRHLADLFTLKSPEDVNAWVKEVHEKLKDAIAKGPVIV